MAKKYRADAGLSSYKFEDVRAAQGPCPRCGLVHQTPEEEERAYTNAAQELVSAMLQHRRNGGEATLIIQLNDTVPSMASALFRLLAEGHRPVMLAHLH